ncbi:Endolytic peptidoglycan transglycosylase RlpA [Burkholderiales bacterium]|nr:Endolytic peptidoglycan transglycosylase RlpA [Burkholderiales bacterium]
MRMGPVPGVATAAAFAALAAALLASCTTAPAPSPRAAAPVPSTKYYADDGPPANPPETLDSVPDAVPRAEPLHRFANRPYVVLGREYVPATSLGPYRERGTASWYGRKFHGQRTSIGEIYDMYAMTAAHPTLPLPSYARVTGVASGRSVVVRVNDRGPFLHGRIIDLSYAAAHRLGIAQRGSGEVIVESVLPGAATFASAAPASEATGTVTTPLATAPPIAASPAPVVAAPVPLAAGAIAAAETPVQTAPGGFVVQLGAFASEPNARTFLAHVQGQLAAAEVAPRVRQSGGLYRVYVGPYASRDDARRTADRLENALGVSTAIAPH